MIARLKARLRCCRMRKGIRHWVRERRIRLEILRRMDEHEITEREATFDVSMDVFEAARLGVPVPWLDG